MAPGRTMTIAGAQRDVRTVFEGGAVGSVVSGVVWLASAIAATITGPASGILVVVIGGMFIFPITQLALRLAGRPWRLPPGHPMNGLAMQVAFVIPATLPVVGAAALYRLEWFYPALAVVVGAHYLPFAFLYGMRSYLVLAGVLVVGGVAIALQLPGHFTPAGWFVGVTEVLFGVRVVVALRTR